MTPEPERRLSPRIENLRAALDLPPLADEETFTSVLTGWVALADAQMVEVSLLLASVSSRWPLGPDLVSDALGATLRQGDVIAQLDDGTYAVVVDAGQTGAVRIAHRVKAAFEAIPTVHNVWIGLATAAPPVDDPYGVLGDASAALGRSLGHADGWIEVGP